MLVYLEVALLVATWTSSTNFNLELVLGPHAIMPLLDYVYTYNKFAQYVISLCMIVLTKWRFINWNSTISIMILITNLMTQPLMNWMFLKLSLTRIWQWVGVQIKTMRNMNVLLLNLSVLSTLWTNIVSQHAMLNLCA